MSINSFGFGGANVHAVLEANENRNETENSSRQEPRLAFACARTADGCENILKCLKENPNNVELQALITENSYHPSHTHPYRGFTLLNSSESSTTIKVIDCLVFSEIFVNKFPCRNVIANEDQYGLYSRAWVHNGLVWDMI